MKILGFFGKGGTGKTTLTALILRELVRRREGTVLAVDADANECLASVLGADGTPTLSDMLQKYKRQREESPELTGIDRFQNLFVSCPDGGRAGRLRDVVVGPERGGLPFSRI